MVATKYSYTISTDFSSGLNSESLSSEINASAIATSLLRIGTVGDICDIWFSDALSAGDKTLLDNDASPPTAGSLIGDHSGVGPIRTKFGASSGLFDGEVVITQDSTWQDLGGRVTNIGTLMVLLFGHTDMSRAIGQVPFKAKTTGTGAQLRLVEVQEDGTMTTLLSTPHAIGDTSGAWQYQRFTTDVAPTNADRDLRLQGRLNGATAATVGNAAMTLLDVGL